MTSQPSHTFVIHDCRHKHIYKINISCDNVSEWDGISCAHVHECLDDACAHEMQMPNAMLNTMVLHPSLSPKWESYCCFYKKSGRVQNTLHNMWSKGKEEREICPDFMALNRWSLRRWLEDQTWLDCHKTWQAHSSLRIPLCLMLVWVLDE